jgi:hypothetical protein
MEKDTTRTACQAALDFLRTVTPVPLRQRREASAIAGATWAVAVGSAANASSAIVTGAATHDLLVDVDL